VGDVVGRDDRPRGVHDEHEQIRDGLSDPMFVLS
jgi:hypothetical protein